MDAASPLSDWQLLRGFWSERWRHRHPKPFKALACRCYRSLDKVLKTVLLSQVVIPQLREYAAATPTAGAAAASNDTLLAPPTLANVEQRARATQTATAVAAALVASFLVNWWCSRQYVNLRGNSGTRKDLRSWLLAKVAWWGETAHSAYDSMRIFNTMINAVDEAVKKCWHMHYELLANAFDLLCQLTLVVALAGVSWLALLPLALLPYLATVVWAFNRTLISRVGARHKADDAWVATVGDVLSNWRMISALGLSHSVGRRFHGVYTAFYHAHRRARFCEHDYKHALALGGELCCALVLVISVRLVLVGDLGLGAFVGLISTMRRITSSLPKIASCLTSVQRGVVALRVVSGLINVPIDADVCRPMPLLERHGDYGASTPGSKLGLATSEAASEAASDAASEAVSEAVEEVTSRGGTASRWQVPIREQLSHAELVDVRFSYHAAAGSPGLTQGITQGSVSVMTEATSSMGGGTPDRLMLNGVSVALPLGGLLAVTCLRQGAKAGKAASSTLVKLISGQLVPSGGQVLLPCHLRATLVHEQPLLFVGSLWQNLTCAMELAGSEIVGREKEVWALARTIGIADALIEHPNLRIDEQGLNISSYDRYLICVVRALLTQPNILVVSKPFTVIDSEEARDRLRSCLLDWATAPLGTMAASAGADVKLAAAPEWMQRTWRTVIMGIGAAHAQHFERVANFVESPKGGAGGLSACELQGGDSGRLYAA